MNNVHTFESHSQAVDLLTKYYVKHKGFKIKTPNTNKNEVFRIRNKETYQMLVLKDDLTVTKKKKQGLYDGMLSNEDCEAALAYIKTMKEFTY